MQREQHQAFHESYALLQAQFNIRIIPNPCRGELSEALTKGQKASIKLQINEQKLLATIIINLHKDVGRSSRKSKEKKNK